MIEIKLQSGDYYYNPFDQSGTIGGYAVVFSLKYSFALSVGGHNVIKNNEQKCILKINKR